MRRRLSAAPLGAAGTAERPFLLFGVFFSALTLPARFVWGRRRRPGCLRNAEAQIRRFHFGRKYELVFLPPVSILAVGTFC